MITLIFDFAAEKIIMIIEGTNVKFGNTNFGSLVCGIEGLKLSYEGVCREFPDLETRQDWREEAIERFKDKIKELNDEDKIADYLIKDLKKFGYIPKLKQKKGFRIEKINNGGYY